MPTVTARPRGRLRPATERLLLRVAHLYYVESLTQEEIAPMVGVSRSRISRLLKAAKDRGYVSIRIQRPATQYPDLERALEHALGLREVVVVQASPGDVKLRLGVEAADYLERVLREGGVLGIAWGSTVGEVVNALRSRTVPGLRVVQMTGSIYEPPISAGELTRHVAEALGGHPYLLHAPAVVDSDEVRRAILSDSKIRQVTSMYSKIDVALFGIGAIGGPRGGFSSSLLASGFLSSKEIAALREAGVVADVCSTFLMADGAAYRGPLARRVIAIAPEELARVRVKIAVAGGEEKARAIAAACRAKLVDVLITDQRAANALRSMANGSHSRRTAARPGT